MATPEISWTEKTDHNGRPEFVADVRFGIRDAKGREIGVFLAVCPQDTIHDGEWVTIGGNTSQRAGRPGITCMVRATRDGKFFGPGNPRRHEATSVEAAKADAAKRALASFRKVQAK